MTQRKKSENKYQITQFQWYTLIVNAVVGVGVTTLPRELADAAGRDGWISIILGTFVVMVYAYICIIYNKRFPNKSLVESVPLVVGKKLGLIISCTYIIFTMMVSGIVIRLFMEAIYVYFGMLYPFYVPILLFSVSVVYIVRCGLATLCRMSEIIFFLTLGAIILFLFPHGSIEILNIMPVFENGYMEPIKALPDIGFSFIGLELILVFYPYLESKKKANPITNYAILTSSLFYLGIFVGTVTILGMEMVLVLSWPFVELLKLMRIQALERMDNIFLYVWTSKVLILVAIHYFAGTFSLGLITGKKYHDIWAIVMWIIPISIALFIPDILFLQSLTDKTSKYGGGFIFFLPMILLIVAKIRGIKQDV